jgi:hypothetical protein
MGDRQVIDLLKAFKSAEDLQHWTGCRKNNSSHQQKPVSGKSALSQSAGFWVPAYAGMTVMDV